MCIVRTYVPQIHYKTLEKTITKDSSLSIVNAKSEQYCQQQIAVTNRDTDQLLNLSDQPPPGRKTRRSRLEHSRLAARERRDKEGKEFDELRRLLPLGNGSSITDESDKLDLVTILRTTSVMCRLRHSLPIFFRPCITLKAQQVLKWCYEHLIIESTKGWIVILDADATILYVSESVSLYTGFNPVDMIDYPLSSYINQLDFVELTQMVRQKPGNKNGSHSTTLLRVKSLISPRGRIVSPRQAFEKPAICSCRSVQAKIDGHELILHILFFESVPAGQPTLHFINESPMKAVVRPCPKGLEHNNGHVESFLTRHSLDMRTTYLSENIELLPVNRTFLAKGVSFYEVVHPADLLLFSKALSECLKKGHCKTNYYRLIGRDTKIIWVETEAQTIAYVSKTIRGQCVRCLHTVLGVQNSLDSCYCRPLSLKFSTISIGDGNTSDMASQIGKHNVRPLANKQQRQQSTGKNHHKHHRHHHCHHHHLSQYYHGNEEDGLDSGYEENSHSQTRRQKRTHHVNDCELREPQCKRCLIDELGYFHHCRCSSLAALPTNDYHCCKLLGCDEESEWACCTGFDSFDESICCESSSMALSTYPNHQSHHGTNCMGMEMVDDNTTTINDNIFNQSSCYESDADGFISQNDKRL